MTDVGAAPSMIQVLPQDTIRIHDLIIIFVKITHGTTGVIKEIFFLYSDQTKAIDTTHLHTITAGGNA